MYENPPAIPLLAVAHLVSWLRWSRLVIDWHNYGYTILNVTKKGHWSVAVYKLFEKVFGRGTYANFCVSKAMQADLSKNWGVRWSFLFQLLNSPERMCYTIDLPICIRNRLLRSLTK